jgi:hypothetical protein
MSTTPVKRMGVFLMSMTGSTTNLEAITLMQSKILYIFAAREGTRPPFSRRV